MSKFYAYRLDAPSGIECGIVTEWKLCESKTKGKNAKFKKFNTKGEAEEYLEAMNGSVRRPIVRLNYGEHLNNPNPENADLMTLSPKSAQLNKKREKNQIEELMVDDDGGVPEGFTVAWTDGACSNNQSKKSAKGGVGVYFGPNHALNISEPLTGMKQTNQRAELTAVIRALETYRDADMYIITDSLYAINGATAWIKKWKKNKWMNSGAKPVSNRDLWEQLDGLIEGRQVRFHWVKGHSTDEGNIAADRLATAGAEMHVGAPARAPAPVAPAPVPAKPATVQNISASSNVRSIKK